MDVVDFNGDGLTDLAFGRANVLVMLNTLRTVNRAPVADAGDDLLKPYDYSAQSEEEFEIYAPSSDPDMHALTYEWRDETGAIISREAYVDLPYFQPHGTYRYTLTVYDGRGGSDTDDVLVTVTPTKEIVKHTWSGAVHGSWTLVNDSAAASEMRAYDRNLGRAKVAQALAAPTDYVEFSVFVDETQTYKLWLRGKADGDSWANDSAFVQFTGSLDASGKAAWRIGTTSALAFNLEECSGCGLSGWGWEDDGWGAVNKNGVMIRFAEGGWQTIRIQTREDGLSIDQIVLSAEKYAVTRPGTAKNDKTILWQSQY